MCRLDKHCALADGHQRVCRDSNGEMIPQGSRYETDQAVKFRRAPMLEIEGSIMTEFTEDNAAELLPLVREADVLEPYLLYYLWNEKIRELRQSPRPAQFFWACLANHGLEIDLEYSSN